jgi:hypothetical protein
MLRSIASLALVAGASSVAFAPYSTFQIRTDRAVPIGIQMLEPSRREILKVGVALATGFLAKEAATAVPSNGFTGAGPMTRKNVPPGLLGTSVVGVGSKGAPTGKNFAPMITIFDERGCTNRIAYEYKGKKSGDYNDELAVKVNLVSKIFPHQSQFHTMHRAVKLRYFSFPSGQFPPG